MVPYDGLSIAGTLAQSTLDEKEVDKSLINSVLFPATWGGSEHMKWSEYQSYFFLTLVLILLSLGAHQHVPQ